MNSISELNLKRIDLMVNVVKWTISSIICLVSAFLIMHTLAVKAGMSLTIFQEILAYYLVGLLLPFVWVIYFKESLSVKRYNSLMMDIPFFAMWGPFSLIVSYPDIPKKKKTSEEVF